MISTHKMNGFRPDSIERVENFDAAMEDKHLMYWLWHRNHSTQVGYVCKETL